MANASVFVTKTKKYNHEKYTDKRSNNGDNRSFNWLWGT